MIWLDQAMAPSYLGFLIACGVALLVSIPLPISLEAYRGVLGPLTAPLFLYVYPLAAGVLGLNLGAISAFREERRWVVVRLAGRIALANVAAAPLVVFVRSLSPDSGMALVLSVAAAFLSGLLWAVISRLVEENRRRPPGKRRAIKYLAFAACVLLPIPAVPALSPVTSGAGFIEGITGGRVALGTVVPLVAVGVAVMLLRHRLGGDRGG